jgi:hypothetical protein
VTAEDVTDKESQSEQTQSESIPTAKGKGKSKDTSKRECRKSDRTKHPDLGLRIDNLQAPAKDKTPTRKKRVSDSYISFPTPQGFRSGGYLELVHAY